MSLNKTDADSGASLSDVGLEVEYWEPVCTTELNALIADAERYRWLRSRVWANDPNIFSMPTIVRVDGANIMRGSVAQHFDEAIDSKMNVARLLRRTK